MNVYLGQTPLQHRKKKVTGKYLTDSGETFYKIIHYDQMRPFFITLISPSDHWLFISSNGGLSAGRKDSHSALFPYYTDDKITDAAPYTGSKSIFRVLKNRRVQLWEPFSDRYAGVYKITRNLYKNQNGNKIIFEEINLDLGLTFRYSWTFSDRYGFVKKSTLINRDQESVHVTYLDGIQNILPYGVPTELQNIRSNLADAYKKNELDKSSGVGIFSLSAMIIDKAEPSEALLATTVWSAGIPANSHLLSSLQLDAFRQGKNLKNEAEIKAERGAYFIHGDLTIKAKEEVSWFTVSDVNQSASAIVAIKHELSHPKKLLSNLIKDIKSGREDLVHLVGKADGIQRSNDPLISGRHFSNVLYNIMRGGLFSDSYSINTADLKVYASRMNRLVYTTYASFFDTLPPVLDLSELRGHPALRDSADLRRICIEYLPLFFSRRHGDPSRPWNQFTIETKDDQGRKINNYEGNWRDIFQNWEALAFSFPEFTEGFIHKFLNASTIDGYNPYRISREGIDWETIEENDPWSFIGYWGDHQIIYLLKLLELYEAHYPGRLNAQLNADNHVFAHVPYRIKNYNDIVKNPYDTIDFDHESQNEIDKNVQWLGADGKLLLDDNQQLIRCNFAEKILITALTKLYNYIPEAGIWLNTQRPEWNDANNALVGNGTSMVTLYYLRRFLVFCIDVFKPGNDEEIILNQPVAELLNEVSTVFNAFSTAIKSSFSDTQRKAMMDALGRAGEKYRNQAYQGFNGIKTAVRGEDVISFLKVALQHLEHSINKNKHPDGLYHAYNVISIFPERTQIEPLYEMLEGQVAVLSANYLSANEAAQLLNALKKSKIYRDDQYSYMLYPDRKLPLFQNKNLIPASFSKRSKLAKALIEANDYSLVEKDLQGRFHFNGSFHNSDDLKAALDHLATGPFQDLVKREYDRYLSAFENLFNHKKFTGRSGTFFGYEGLGSIYWHMVSKLLLAVQENIFSAFHSQAPSQTMGNLIEHYYEIRAGIGINKSPDLYGAFPTDAYSHTPANKGAQQPGMTGQVKEDVINRWAELGVVVKGGQIHFEPILFKQDELLKKPGVLNYFDSHDKKQSLRIPAGRMAFTYCQTVIEYRISSVEKLEVNYFDGSKKEYKTPILPQKISTDVFERNGKIKQITFHFMPKL